MSSSEKKTLNTADDAPESTNIIISLEKYEELITAKRLLALVKRAYMADKPFHLQDQLSLLFGFSKKDGDSNA